MSDDKNKGVKEHHCTICGKLSAETICHRCEERIRGEALERKKDVEKSGRVDTGRG